LKIVKNRIKMKKLLLDPGFWICIAILLLFFTAIVSMKSKENYQYKQLPTDKEINKIEGRL